MNTADIKVKTFPFLLNGKWISDSDTADVRAPFSGELVANVTYGTRKHAEEAVDAATVAFEKTRKLPAYERQRILSATARILQSRANEFAEVVAQESGKPIKVARQEVARAVFVLDVSSEEAGRIYGEVLPLDLLPSAEGRWGIVRPFPIGPVSAITAFNFPLVLAAHKIAPAIAAGCSVILKPPPQDPISTLMMAELFHQVGVPDGAINVVPLSNENAAPLIEDDRVRLLTFTGSATAGWNLRKRAGNKRVVLELGGNAAVIVHSDADLEYAAERCVLGAFNYAGQSCVSVQRMYVHRDVKDQFIEALLVRVRALKLGNPLEEDTDIGPLIREAEAARVAMWIDEALAAGARLLCGGDRKGPLLGPTLLTNTSRDMRVNCREIFGPVATVELYESFDDVLQLINDSPYGLQTGLFTRDIRLILRAYEELQVGGLIAGDIPTWRMDHMPYGGIKESGSGREGVRYTIKEMTEPKLLVVNARP